MKPSTELRELTLHLYEKMFDASFLENLISQQAGVLVIGTDPDEWWADYDTIISLMTAQTEAMSGSSISGDPQAYSQGDVGWVADQSKMVMADGTEINFRITLVFAKEAGDWKIVQWHVSIGIPNEDAGFGDL